jgi:hypothetical protein
MVTLPREADGLQPLHTGAVTVTLELVRHVERHVGCWNAMSEVPCRRDAAASQ